MLWYRRGGVSRHLSPGLVGFLIDPLTAPCLTDTFFSFSLPSFLVIIPAIAQRLVDDAAIPIKFAQVLQPTPDSITFSLSASLKVPLGLSVTIDPLDLSLFNREVKPMKPYITAPLGRIRLKGESAITVSNQTTKIQDQDEFIKFLSKAVYSKRFTLSAYGKTTAHLGKLKVPLKLDKDIELDGMHIQKFPVSSMQPLLTAVETMATQVSISSMASPSTRQVSSSPPKKTVRIWLERRPFQTTHASLSPW